MLEHVCVEIFDHIGVVLLEIWVAAESDSQKNHVFGTHDVAHILVDLIDQCFVEKLISDGNLLAFK